MSGIELAGLIIGVFPLLIHALERYGEGAELLSDWWRIQRAYKKCKHDLEYHQILFEENVERFLLPLVVDDDELKTLMNDPAGELWEEKELEDRLKERLPKSYQLFLGIMGDINDLMESMKKELGVHNAQFVAKINERGELDKANGNRSDLLSKSHFEFQAKRLRFSLKKSSRQKLFSQLQDANDRLRRLLESSDQIAAARHTREVKKPKSMMNRKINEFWMHAKRLHEALSKAWLCGCSNHTANLQLQHRTSDDVEFDVLFGVDVSTGKRDWKETKIKMVSGESTSDTTIHISLAQPAVLPVRAARQVHWNTPQCQPSKTFGKDDMMKIMDLCSTLSKGRRPCFGFLDGDGYRFEVYPGQQTVAGIELETVSLDALLHHSRSPLTRRRRYYLALILASSYLQLCSTPWLNAPLRKDSILFLRDPSSEGRLLIDNPYICRKMAKQPTKDANDAISTLGIRLLELCFGIPLEECEFRRQLPPGDEVSGPILDRAAAVLWSKTVNEEAGSDFADAIEWCLHAKELSDGSWRREIWTRVIDPLENCHRQVS